MSLLDTPRATRLHIGIYGKRNSGKSTLINALTHQSTSIVSTTAGTTTDPVYKSMEIHGIGPCIFIDTPGFDDKGVLGTLRVKKTIEAAEKTDIALILFSDEDISEEINWFHHFRQIHTPVIPILNKIDVLPNIHLIANKIEQTIGAAPLLVDAQHKQGISKIYDEILRLLPEDYQMTSITDHLAKPGDLVLLVMPQDIQAPKGRLILPQVQTMRDLLDKKCLVMSCTTDCLTDCLASLNKAPDLIITDSQAFQTVYEKKPASSKLSSFSVLFARYKGDIDAFVEGAYAIENLTPDSKVLIAEACTHVPLAEDIGREKIPHLLRQRIGESLSFDIVSGPHLPDDLSSYDLIIHCGGCMFNRKYVLSRMAKAKAKHVPITNYGVVIAYLTGIIDKICY